MKSNLTKYIVLILIIVSALFFSINIPLELNYSNFFPVNNSNITDFEYYQQIFPINSPYIFSVSSKTQKYSPYQISATIELKKLLHKTDSFDYFRYNFSDTELSNIKDIYFTNIFGFADTTTLYKINELLSDTSMKKRFYLYNNRDKFTFPKSLLIRAMRFDMFGIKKYINSGLTGVDTEKFKYKNGFIYILDNKSSVIVANSNKPYYNIYYVKELDEKINKVKKYLEEKYSMLSIKYVSENEYIFKVLKSIKETLQYNIIIYFVSIFLITFLMYRSLTLSINFFVPMLSGLIIIFLILYITNHGYTFFNLSVVPIILGLGWDYIFHIFHRIKTDRRLILQSSLKSFSITGIFLLILIFSDIPELRSFGLLSFLSIGIIIMVSFLTKISPFSSTFAVKCRNSRNDNAEPSKWYIYIAILLFIVFGIYVLINLDKVQYDFSFKNFKLKERTKSEFLPQSRINFNNAVTLIIKGNDYEGILENNDSIIISINNNFNSENIVIDSIRRFIPNKDMFNNQKKLQLDLSNLDKKLFKKRYNSIVKKYIKEDKYLLEYYPEQIEKMLANTNPVTINDYYNADLQDILKPYVYKKNNIIHSALYIYYNEKIYNNLFKFLSHYSNRNQNIIFTGQDKLSYSLKKNLLSRFFRYTLMTFFIAVLLIMFYFRKVQYILIVLLPLIISTIIILTVTILFQIKFGILSITFIPLLIGLSMHPGIYIVDLYKKGLEYNSIVSKTFIPILLSVVSSTISISIFIFSDSKAYINLGIISLIGFLSIIIGTLVLYTLLRLMCDD